MTRTCVRGFARFVAALAIVVALWAVLGAIAWTAGVLPRLPGGAMSAPDAGPSAAPVDAGAPSASRDAGLDRGALVERVAPEPERPPSPWSVPPSPDAPVDGDHRTTFALADPVLPFVQSVVAGALLGDARPEIVVGLGDRFEVLEPGETGDGTPTLRRVATITQISRDPAFLRSAPRAAIGDVTGDGRADLVIAFWRRTDGGGSRGGGAWVLRGLEDGTLDRPVSFAGSQVIASSVGLLDLDGRGGLDVVIGDRGQPFGEVPRPGRVLLYAGGRRPTSIAEHAAAIDLRMVLPAHADGDERVDLVAVGEVVVRFRDLGRGRFERMEGEAEGILFADVPHAFSGDLDGDRWLEAYVRTTVHDGTLIVGRTGERHLPFEFDPAHDDDGRLHAIVALGDTDGDRRTEALVLHSVANDWRLGDFDAAGEPRSLRPMHGGHPWRGHDGALVDLDLDGVVEVVTLDSLYDEATDGITYWLSIAAPCTDCSPRRVEGTIADQGSAAFEVR